VELGVKLNKGDDLNSVLNQFDILIDFTRPEATLDYLAICMSANKAIVIGTTGFDDASSTAYLSLCNFLKKYN
jgi:4-hydroxy-tetrahydrodipicolinate reductase